MASISFKDIQKVYSGNVKAVNDFNLEVEDKEFVVFVGPSGCGKSTTLRMIAGLEDITEGTISIGGKVINDILPKDRDIAMVFQNYALYPHMTVYDNMAFALKLKKIPKDEIDKRVKNAAKILGIENLLTRKPKALSGGQRQRVALGRAIVREAKVFLMDEPLSNLDAKLRVQTRTEIIALHQKLKTTFIYVTHDQTEAMTMGDRIIVMKDGIIQQTGSPNEIYNKPVNMFVAGFIGSPQMNFINVKLIKTDNDTFGLNFGNYSIHISGKLFKTLKPEKLINKEFILGIRPENIDVNLRSEDKNKDNTQIISTVDVAEEMGSDTYLYFKLEKSNFIARVKPTKNINASHQVDIRFDENKIHLFDVDTEISIL